MPKIKIDVSAGIFEVEGEEAFVQDVFSQYKNRIPTKEEVRSQHVDILEEHKKKIRARGQTKKRAAKSASLQIVKDLDLSGKSSSSTFKDFYNKMKPSSAMENNLVCTYFLTKLFKEENKVPVTVDHIFTCYKSIGIKVPLALKQSIFDTAHRKGWLDTTDIDDIQVTIAGENYIEHDLPKTSSDKKE